jgi:hypothetical protein
VAGCFHAAQFAAQAATQQALAKALDMNDDAGCALFHLRHLMGFQTQQFPDKRGDLTITLDS